MVCTRYHTLKYQTWIYWLLLAIFCLTGTIQTILRIYFFEEFEARLCRRVFSYEKCLFLKGFYERWKWCKLDTNKLTRQYLLSDIFDQHHGLCKKSDLDLMATLGRLLCKWNHSDNPKNLLLQGIWGKIVQESVFRWKVSIYQRLSCHACQQRITEKCPLSWLESFCQSFNHL